MGDVEGQVTEVDHTGWIEITSCDASCSRSVESRIGSGESRIISRPMVTDIQLSKLNDKATIAIFKSSLSGKSGEALIHFTQSFGDALRTYYEITLTDTVISSHSIGAGEDGMIREALSLNFTKMAHRNTPHDATGNPGGAQTGEYNLATGEVA